MLVSIRSRTLNPNPAGQQGKGQVKAQVREQKRSHHGFGSESSETFRLSVAHTDSGEITEDRGLMGTMALGVTPSSYGSDPRPVNREPGAGLGIVGRPPG